MHLNLNQFEGSDLTQFKNYYQINFIYIYIYIYIYINLPIKGFEKLRFCNSILAPTDLNKEIFKFGNTILSSAYSSYCYFFSLLFLQILMNLDIYFNVYVFLIRFLIPGRLSIVSILLLEKVQCYFCFHAVSVDTYIHTYKSYCDKL